MEGLNILHRIIRAILIVTPIIILGWLTINKLVPSGQMEAVYDMKNETPFISKLYPTDRVSEIKKADDDFYRSFLDEPVYFDLKPNNQFEKVAVTVKYKIFHPPDDTNFTIVKGLPPIVMGGLLNKKDWTFDWRVLTDLQILKTKVNQWQTQTEIFDFSRLMPEDNKFRFVFSVPMMQPGQAGVSEIKVVFERKPLTLKDAVNKILDAVAWRINHVLSF
jgi:hypothetical protein